MLGMLFFVYGFDTAPRGTHNLGLLNDRLVGIIFSATIALIGAVIALGGIPPVLKASKNKSHK